MVAQNRGVAPGHYATSPVRCQMPYCPSCQAEYREGTEKCSDCGDALVETLPTESDRPVGERIDLFVCYREQLVGRVLGVLQDGGIEGLVRFRGSTAFPMNVGTENQHIIAVLAKDLDKALELVRAAVADDLFGDDGKLLISDAGASGD